MKKKICITLGTRPEIIRLATLINQFRKDRSIDVRVVYTGQHYDYLMNDIFFKELNINFPDVDLKIGSGSHSIQTAKIMISIEKYFEKYKPDMVVVFGDTNSSLAVALTAVKMKIPLTHLEAGGREWEMDVPEEINRRIIDNCANLLVAASDTFVRNLKNEKVLGDIYNCGDLLFDTFKQFSEKKPVRSLDDLSVKRKEYIFLTLHRDINVDKRENLRKILNAIVSTRKSVIFPVHPRTKKQLEKLKYPKDFLKNIKFFDPFGYQDTIYFIKNAKLAITDSGGLQKEAFWCETPCITLRKHTSWIETVTLGGNFLTEIDEEKIKKRIAYVIKNESKIALKIRKSRNPYVKPDITVNTIKLIKKYAGHSWETK